MDFIKRHSVLFGILSFIFITLPADIEGIWSLIERIQSLNIVAPQVSILWLTWVTAPLGLFMLIVIIRQTRKNKLPTETTTLSNDKQQAQIRFDIGLLVIEGTEVLKGFKSVHTFADAWPIEEFQAWRGKVTDILQRHGLNTEYTLWYRDAGINIADSVLVDYINACEAGLDRLEDILKTLK